jgi:hypothetical protein
VSQVSCTKKTTTPEGEFDNCFNTGMLNALNLLRQDHVEVELTLDEDNAAALHAKVNDKTLTWNSDVPPTIELPSGNKHMQLWWKDTNVAA